MRYCINGKFLTDRITGMQRYALEMTKQLDALCSPGEMEIVVPRSAENLPRFQHLTVVKYGRLKGIPWEQICLPAYLYQHHLTGIHMLSNVPILKSGDIVVAHGVNNKVNPQFYKTVRDKVSRLWHNIVYHFYFKNAHTIFTVSIFSKSEITRAYHVKEEYLHIVPCAWQHMESIEADESIFEKNRDLQRGSYYFSMSSVNENKNFKWIAKAAEYNRKSSFFIAGGRSLQEYFRVNGIRQPENLHFLGYVTDGEAKALMRHCKAFLFPTFYEGFGIPPMEAMSCGAQAIVSNTPTMHEVYGGCVHYIDPQNPNVDLDSILKEDVSPADIVLKKYSWEKSARAFYEVLLEKMGESILERGI